MSVEAMPENRIEAAPDREEIIRVMRLYTDGIGAHRPEMFAEAFHPLARIYWTTDDGTFHEELIANAHDGWANWDDLAPVTARFISVIQAGEVASVVLGFDVHDDPMQSWLDIHSLLRVDGTWKIMNKTATHASRADWAGLGAMHEADARHSE